MSEVEAAPRAEAILEGVGAAIIAFDRAGRIRWANQAAAQLAGYPSVRALLAASVDEVKARFEITDERGQTPAPGTPGRRALDGEAGAEALLRVRLRATGEERWCLVSSQPVRDAQGDVEFAVSVFLDFTARKQQAESQQLLAAASRALASSLDYQATLKEVARLGLPLLADWCAVHLLEPDGRLQLIALAHRERASEAASWELGLRYPPRVDDPVGPAAVVRSGRAELIAEIPPAALEAVAQDPAHLELLRASGLESVMIVPLSARGRTLGALTFAFAGSGRRYTQARLEVAEELATRAALAIDNARLYQQEQAAVRARDELLAIVSHDLKNPLAAILVSAGALSELLPVDDEPTRSRADVIRRAAQRMHHLIAQLLESAKIEAGRLPVERKAYAMGALIADALGPLDSLARTKALTLESRVTPCEALCDRERVLQVLSNVIGNAIQFSPEGGAIVVEVEPVGGEVRVAVRDHGCGVALEEQPHLFERYWQGRARREGSGLGLYIAKGIVDAHGGRIWCESQPGHGSAFFFTLPAA
jgi:PAS domain S-box-containing protein